MQELSTTKRNKISIQEPEFLSFDEIGKIESDSRKLAELIYENPHDVEITASLYAVGQEAFSKNTLNVGLIEDKINSNPFDSGGFDKSLGEIKSQLDLINPKAVGGTKQPFKTKLLWIIPWTVKRLPKSEEIMSIINKKKDSVKDTVEGLQEHLWSERDKCNRNSVELSLICDKLNSVKEELDLSIYQGQLMWQYLADMLDEEQDEVKRNSLQRIVNDISTIVVDLQTGQVLNAQTRMGAESLIHNSSGVNKLVDRINNILLPSVSNLLAVKVAADQQQSIVNIGNAIMESASQTMKETASSVNQTIVETAKANSQSLVHIEAIQESCQSFEDARIELQKLFVETENNTREISSKLSNTSKRLSKHIGVVGSAKVIETDIDDTEVELVDFIGDVDAD